MINLFKNSEKENIMGTKCIANFVAKLPNAPGVYRMMDKHQNLLYVGKAKDLKKRVSSYTKLLGHSARIQKMISQTADMEFIITNTEVEALLLEANLIKQLKPYYNILLRDNKSFPYIIITKDSKFPGIYKHRGEKNIKGSYFGPFANTSAVNKTIKSLQKAFLIRSCSDSFFTNRSRPCLLYQINRCSAPCTNEISYENYIELIKQAEDFLSGNGEKVRQDIINDMQKYSQRLEFERASIYRDRLEALAHIQTKQYINSESLQEADIFAIYQNGNQACVEVFFFRLGQNWGNHTYYIKIYENLSNEEILGKFLLQFYEDKPVARVILTSNIPNEKNIIQSALSIKSTHKVNINTPTRGEKYKIVSQALLNAREALSRKITSYNNNTALLKQLSECFQLKKTPSRIEVYDNSHIMGNSSVGAMIAYVNGNFQKDQYRKYNIDTSELTPGDDFAMMKQVISRRFSRLIKEKAYIATGDIPLFPDLLLIDGGKGQLSSVVKIINELNSDEFNILEHLDIIAISKGVQRNAGDETFHLINGQEVKLDNNSSLIYFLQNLRDEAHRFAIGSHRILRKKNMMTNPLDEIPNIGSRRKRALLNYFGSAKAISQATIDELAKVEGISLNLAKIIYSYFH